MAARCASCSYPLSVSDSVSCCECMSYFHIDCAQLVGFPYYELSSDPIRNTFHCQTCKILPLPRQCDSDSDSDSDDGMPSRQLEYHLEGQDFAADMNEVKGTVQDLSDLCKDMFREISELKSINLTLRCCVENLRHDGEQRDSIITDLKRRLEVLEGKRGVNLFKPIDIAGTYTDELNIEKEEDPERFLTPDPEYSRAKELETYDQGSYQSKRTPPPDYEQDFLQPNLKCDTSETALKCEQITNHTLEISETTNEIPILETINFIHKEKIREDKEEDNMHYAEEETISTEVGEDNTEASAVTKDWSWKGNKAIQLKESDDQSPEEEDQENETTDIEDTEAQGWEILEEVVTSDLTTAHLEEVYKQIEVLEVEAVEERRVTWADEVEECNEEDENVKSNEDTEEPELKAGNEYSTEIDSVNEGCSSLEGEETEEKTENISDGGDRTSLKSIKSEEGDVIPKLEEDVEKVEENAEAEGRTEDSRLEGEPRLEGEGAGLEGVLEGGQSPEHQGEVQPSELPEGSEPLPPPQPQHTPDDLWDYLKETVSGEHPATVEEFVQKLIGTLEHVPEEYLKPVIDYNIKRATSPSVTDGEHLEPKEGDQGLQEEVHVTEETATQEACPEGEVALEGEASTIAPPQGEGEGFPSEESALYEDKNFPEEPSESSAGYSAVEATL